MPSREQGTRNVFAVLLLNQEHGFLRYSQRSRRRWWAWLRNPQKQAGGAGGGIVVLVCVKENEEKMKFATSEQNDFSESVKESGSLLAR